LAFKIARDPLETRANGRDLSKTRAEVGKARDFQSMLNNER
jgi:hypothetical protein